MDRFGGQASRFFQHRPLTETVSPLVCITVDLGIGLVHDALPSVDEAQIASDGHQA
jgi:hypothetical protein